MWHASLSHSALVRDGISTCSHKNWQACSRQDLSQEYIPVCCAQQLIVTPLLMHVMHPTPPAISAVNCHPPLNTHVCLCKAWQRCAFAAIANCAQSYSYSHCPILQSSCAAAATLSEMLTLGIMLQPWQPLPLPPPSPSPSHPHPHASQPQ